MVMKAKHLLVVDDCEIVQRVMSRIFLNTEFHCTCVGSGEAALTVLAQHHFPVIFMDIQMPGMNGLDLCDRIRQRFPLTYRICFSSSIDGMTLEEGRRAGFDQFFAKPCPAEVLIEEARLGFASLHRWFALVGHPLDTVTLSTPINSEWDSTTPLSQSE